MQCVCVFCGVRLCLCELCMSLCLNKGECSGLCAVLSRPNPYWTEPMWHDAQIQMEPSVVNGSVHTGGKERQSNWPQIYVLASSVYWARECFLTEALFGSVHTGAPRNRHTVINGSIQTACKQHQRKSTQICMQICSCVLCERGLRR